MLAFKDKSNLWATHTTGFSKQDRVVSRIGRRPGEPLLERSLESALKIVGEEE
jgi:hypothetical protein